jgi:hypothetical protein
MLQQSGRRTFPLLLATGLVAKDIWKVEIVRLVNDKVYMKLT